MIKITCEKCGQTFSSETEYREHKAVEDFLVQQKQLMGEVAEQQRQGFLWLASYLRMVVVIQIMKQEGLGFEAAFRRCLEYGEIVNKVLAEKGSG